MRELISATVVRSKATGNISCLENSFPKVKAWRLMDPEEVFPMAYNETGRKEEKLGEREDGKLSSVTLERT